MAHDLLCYDARGLRLPAVFTKACVSVSIWNIGSALWLRIGEFLPYLFLIFFWRLHTINARNSMNMNFLQCQTSQRIHARAIYIHLTSFTYKMTEFQAEQRRHGGCENVQLWGKKNLGTPTCLFTLHGWKCHPFAPPMTLGKAQLTRLNGPVALVYRCIELRREDKVSIFLVVTWCDIQDVKNCF